jgi:nicotinamidase-related amidase
MTQLTMTLRSQRPGLDARGNYAWDTIEQPLTVAPGRVALVLCDLWDGHYCPALTQRLDDMIPRMNRVVHALRDRGAVIVHAPSDATRPYAGTPALQRALAIEPIDAPALIEHDDPPLPICSEQETACSTPDCELGKGYTQQHPGIDICHDNLREYISDDDQTPYAILKHHGIEQVILMGVHTNMCILLRQFGIKQMVRRGVAIAFVRDLTDAAYNPMTWPYVSHDDGTRLMVAYIEKFWCPTVHSDQLLGHV